MHCPVDLPGGQTVVRLRARSTFVGTGPDLLDDDGVAASQRASAGRIGDRGRRCSGTKRRLASWLPADCSTCGSIRP